MNALMPRVGVLALTLELYETLAPALRPSREAWLRSSVLPALKGLAEPSFPRAVFTRRDVENAVAAFEAERVDALLVILLSYSPSQIALPALQRTRLPILVWNLQQLHAVTPAFSSADMIDNHGVHGTQDLANVLLRSRVPFEYVTSHLDDPDATVKVARFLRAAAAVRQLRNARLGLMGYPFCGMGDFALDTTHLAATLGCQPVQIPVEDYISRAAAAQPRAVADLVADYRGRYDLAPNLAPDDLAATARAELALRALAKERSLDGLTYQFQAFGEDERTETVPFVAASRLMADGLAFGGEGDLIAVAGTLLLHLLAGQATFSEIFTTDYAGNGLFLSHMGEMNVAMAPAGRKIPLVARQFPITRTRRGQLTLVTTLAAGPATLMALTQGPGPRWRLIASALDVADTAPLAMDVPHARLTCRRDVRDFLTAYAKAGGPHHNALCFGDARPLIAAAATLLDADYVEV